MATFFALVACIGAIATTIVLIRRRDSTTDSSTFRAGQTENSQDTPVTEDVASAVEAGAQTPPTAATTALPPRAAATTAPPTEGLAVNPRAEWGQTTFYVIADVPYNDDEREEMPGLVADIPKDGAFAVHLGDIKHADESCNQVSSG